MGADQHHASYSNYKSGGNKEEILAEVLDSYNVLSAGIRNWTSNLSNCSSLLWYAYRSLNIPVNWTGFYMSESEESLILGPFQGKVACQQIKVGKGVCGTAASTREVQVVPDVEKFPGHIACDGETKSEIVVPIVKNGKVVGVIDIDCLKNNAFNDVDKKYLVKLAEAIVETCDF